MLLCFFEFSISYLADSGNNYSNTLSILNNCASLDSTYAE